jgi:methionine synthase I (cobalamin-dependent)
MRHPGRFEKGGILFDGAMGSMLIAQGLPSGRPPEEWILSRPESIKDVHRAYLEAGADVITTNTFGATPARLSGFGLADEVEEINAAAVRLAREAVEENEKSFSEEPREGTRTRHGKKLVALSMGPTGLMLPPVGRASEEDIASSYRRQVEGASGGVDLILIETIFDLREGLIALEAARAAGELPVAVTLTFDKKPRGFFTYMGDEAAASMKRLEEAGADIVGANCTLTSPDMVELARILRDSTSLPVLCQPNAGKPRMQGGIIVYDASAEDFAADAIKILECGVNAVGGCCGTNPDFIRSIRAGIESH